MRKRRGRKCGRGRVVGQGQYLGGEGPKQEQKG